MADTINDGGPAFPLHPDIRDDEPHAGMSMRDYFAAAALQGMLANAHPVQSDEHMFARDAYTVADAMLKAREGAE